MSMMTIMQRCFGEATPGPENPDRPPVERRFIDLSPSLYRDNESKAPVRSARTAVRRCPDFDDMTRSRAGVKYVLSNTNTNANTFFSGVSNTNTNTPAKILSNTNTNTNTAHQIQIHNEAETKLPPFYR